MSGVGLAAPFNAASILAEHGTPDQAPQAYQRAVAQYKELIRQAPSRELQARAQRYLEETTKRLLYLVAISRKLPDPLSAIVLSQSGAGKSGLTEAIERLTPPERAILEQTLSCSAIGAPTTVRHALEAFVARTGADELMITSQIFDHKARLRSYEITSGLQQG